MINTWIDFEKNFRATFGAINEHSLASLNEGRLRLELGGDGTDLQRIRQAKGRSSQLLNYCFKGKELWIRIILWGDEEDENLQKAGLNVSNAHKVFTQKNDDSLVLYLCINRDLDLFFEPLSTSIINFEMAQEPAANITCYFISLEVPLIVNIYDDRGVDIFSPNNNALTDIKRVYSDWLLL